MIWDGLISDPESLNGDSACDWYTGRLQSHGERDETVAACLARLNHASFESSMLSCSRNSLTECIPYPQLRPKYCCL
jgi:hypothetical protein